MVRDLCIWPPYLRCLCAVQHLVQLHQTECDWSGDNPGGTSQLKSVYVEAGVAPETSADL